MKALVGSLAITYLTHKPMKEDNRNTKKMVKTAMTQRKIGVMVAMRVLKQPKPESLKNA